MKKKLQAFRETGPEVFVLCTGDPPCQYCYSTFTSRFHFRISQRVECACNFICGIVYFFPIHVQRSDA